MHGITNVRACAPRWRWRCRWYALERCCLRHVRTCVPQVALALQVVRFGEMLEDMLDDLLPNRITEYAYELSNLFSAFYTECKARAGPAPVSINAR